MGSDRYAEVIDDSVERADERSRIDGELKRMIYLIWRTGCAVRRLLCVNVVSILAPKCEMRNAKCEMMVARRQRRSELSSSA